jgi:indole-3-glycerol phosphate synthase
LSQAIAEGDGISFIVEVSDSAGAKSAEAQGADGLAVITNANSVRMTSALPLLHLGRLFDAQGSASDAVVIKPDLAMWDEGHALGLECVVRVTESSELERVLHYFDPEVFLLSVPEDANEDEDPLAVLLELLHDVPAGKLAIAELPDATPEDVSELERSGVDAVLVSAGDLETLIQAGPPDV